jgi:hypothetical protein
MNPGKLSLTFGGTRILLGLMVPMTAVAGELPVDRPSTSTVTFGRSCGPLLHLPRPGQSRGEGRPPAGLGRRRDAREPPDAVVEAKAAATTDGVPQASDYAQILGLKFAATIRHESLDFDLGTGLELQISEYATPPWNFGSATARLRAPSLARRGGAGRRVRAPAGGDHTRGRPRAGPAAPARTPGARSAAPRLRRSAPGTQSPP